MDLRIRVKPAEELLDTRLIQQTRYWSRVKSSLGWQPLAADLEVDGKGAGDLLLLVHEIGEGSMAYAPYGPEALPNDERRGEYLAILSEELKRILPPSCVVVRWDLPWESPYARDEDRYDEKGHWLGPPETRLRELRMNWGVEGSCLRKAPSDLLPPDTFLIDLRQSEEALLSRMKPKTRYNIGLAGRKGVSVRIGGEGDLDTWNALYALTARRNGITPHGPSYFAPLFGASRGPSAPRVRLLVAEWEGEALAAMFLAFSADRATYLYGASSGEKKDLMAPYLLQWEAIRLAKSGGCSSYDLFGVAPRPDPDHPMFGLYQFKRGFGGRLFHREGAWDFPYQGGIYEGLRAAETVSPGFRV